MMKKFSRTELRRIMIIALLGVFALLMMDLNSRLWDLTRLTNERDQALTQVYDQWATRSVLETKIAYGNSEVAVEEWARNEAGWAKPGDQVIVPMAKTARVITPTVLPTPTIIPAENWEVWWALFFSR